MHNFLYLALCALLVWPAHGQETAHRVSRDSVITLPGIEVNATRYQLQNTEIPVRVTYLDQQAVQSTGGRSVGEVLDRAGSVFLRRYGSGLSTLSIRGSSSSQALLLLDGIPLTNPQLGQVDLSLIPTVLVQSIAILHGPGASQYGSNGMGGVVHIQTPIVAEHPSSIQASALLGPFGERTGELTFSSGGKRIRTLVALSHGYEKGDFSFVHPSLIPETRVRREGADRTYYTAFGKLDWLWRRNRTTFSIWYNHHERGLPGSSALPPRDERQWDETQRWSLNHVQPLAGATLQVRGLYQNATLRYNNPFLDIDDTGRTREISFEAIYSAENNTKGTFLVGLNGMHNRARHPSLAAASRETQSSLFTQSNYKIGRFNVFPSVRLDGYGTPGQKLDVVLSPSLGMNYNLLLADRLFVKAQAGRSYRKPTFNDRFWQPGGNTALRPEVSWSFETGVTWDVRFNRGRTAVIPEATLFLHEIRDQITWLPTQNEYWAPDNVEQVRTVGAEISLNTRLEGPGGFSISNKTLFIINDARDRSLRGSPSFNQPLRYTPRHVFKMNLQVEKSWQKWKTHAGFFTRYTSRRFVTTDGSSFLDPFLVLDGQLGGTWNTDLASLSLLLSLENMTDDLYEVIKGYPMPPRVLRIRLTVKTPGM